MSQISLRNVEQEDLPLLFEHQCDADAARLAAFRSRDHDAFMTHWAKIMSDPSACALTILYDGAVAGHIGLFGPPEHREVGYWIAREFWGRGVATAALQELLRTRQERPIHAHVAAHNPASGRVLEKCGFRLLGDDPEFSAPGQPPVRGLIYRAD
jgi:RimJ/RimL family protein N-acetyltransferase